MKTNFDFNKMMEENKLHLYLAMIAICLFGVVAKIAEFIVVAGVNIFCVVSKGIIWLSEYVSDNWDGWMLNLYCKRKAAGRILSRVWEVISSTCILIFSTIISNVAFLVSAAADLWNDRKELINQYQNEEDEYYYPAVVYEEDYNSSYETVDDTFYLTDNSSYSVA